MAPDDHVADPDETWVFGYGSLVSAESVGVTIDREVTIGDGFEPAVLHGYGRCWNYGSLRQRADWHGAHGEVTAGIVVSLGVMPDPDRWANGAIVRVTPDELARLDRRESDYDRVDVTESMRYDRPPEPGTEPRAVVTYVPRRSAIERYERHRRDGTAAVRAGYVTLVEEAFAALGGTHLADYRATTPEPDVEVIEFESVYLRDR